MKKNLIRFIALLLISGLAVDPSLAAISPSHSPSARPHPTQSFFLEQALSAENVAEVVHPIFVPGRVRFINRVTRREFLGIAAGAGAAAIFSSPLLAQTQPAFRTSFDRSLNSNQQARINRTIELLQLAMISPEGKALLQKLELIRIEKPTSENPAAGYRSVTETRGSRATVRVYIPESAFGNDAKVLSVLIRALHFMDIPEGTVMALDFRGPINVANQILLDIQNRDALAAQLPSLLRAIAADPGNPDRLQLLETTQRKLTAINQVLQQSPNFVNEFTGERDTLLRSNTRPSAAPVPQPSASRPGPGVANFLDRPVQWLWREQRGLALALIIGAALLQPYMELVRGMLMASMVFAVAYPVGVGLNFRLTPRFLKDPNHHFGVSA